MMLATHIWSLWLFLAIVLAAGNSSVDSPRCIMYLTGQHVVVPSAELVADVTHVILAFMRSDIFNVDETPKEFPLFTTIEDVRSQFAPNTKVTVAIGGWGDSKGFELAAMSDTTRKRWANRVADMVKATGADGVDIDWEYPGGNRDDYKKIPNSKRGWEIGAFVKLLEQLRTTLGPDKILSAAVPGREVDLMAFTSATVPRITEQLNFFNVMTYDLVNRRNTVTTHHSGVANSRESVKLYMDRGVPASKINLGLGYYVKWFMTQQCDPASPVGCPTLLLEDPRTGDDMGRTGGFSWHDEVPKEVTKSFQRSLTEGKYDTDGSYYYWDSEEQRWWNFDTSKSIKTKFADIMKPLRLGGVFAWGLGEDAPDFNHFQTTTEEVRKMRRLYSAKVEL